MKSKDLTPKLKLSSSQRRVALYRAMQKESSKPSVSPMMQPQQMSQPMGLAGEIANSRAPQVMPNMPASSPSLQPPQSMGMSSMPGAIGTIPPPTMTGSAEVGSPNMEEELGMSSVQEHIQYSLIADQLWKDGGDNSTEVWDRLRRGSKGNHLDSARDYFISSYIKYKDDPAKFKSKHPQEARIIKMLDEAFEASQVKSIIPEGGLIPNA